MTSKLQPGALVELTRQPGAYGVLEDRNGTDATVRWDPGVNLKSKVNVRSLQRVELPPIVSRVGTNELGFLLDLVSGQPLKWRVHFLQSGMRTVSEAALRPKHKLNPIEKIKYGQIGSYEKFRLALVTRYLHLAHLYDDLVSLGHTGVDIKPYQVGVVHRVVTNPNHRHRYLLCDEVGLGKTIEAGMILKELRMRGIVKRCLIIVPPNIRNQWQSELKTKFNEKSAILDSSTYDQIKRNLENPESNENIIVSKAWLTRNWYVEHYLTKVDWDMVIVDEAHHVRSKRQGRHISTTRLYQVVHDLVDPARFGHRAVLFLTAIPMQLQTHELYALIELLDPLLFPSEEDFNSERYKYSGLNRTVEQLLNDTNPIPSEEASQLATRISDWIDMSKPTVRRHLNTSEGHEMLRNKLMEQHRLSEILIRNRKAEVGGFMPRKAYHWEVELTQEEHKAIQQVEEYITEGFQFADTGRNYFSVGLVMSNFQEMMASSMWALKVSLASRRERLLLRKHTASEDEYENFQAERKTLQKLIKRLDKLPVDSKGRKFVQEMRKLFKEQPDMKVLVFTEFKATQQYLKELLEKPTRSQIHIGVNVFHGGMAAQAKDAAVESFRRSRGPQVLISTEAGSEGQNFQFCHYIVNYDLPWNPMRVEQRIGRVDRIGQKNIVQIFNFRTKGTLEEHILDVLENRIRSFEGTVGSLDPILGKTKANLREILRSAPAEREAAIEKFGQRLEQQVKSAREAEVRLRDFIMDTKSYSKEIAQKITGQGPRMTPKTQENFMKALLWDVGTKIQKLLNSEEYELTFDGHGRSLATGSKRWAVFRPDEFRDEKQVELFAFGHPIIDGIVGQVLDNDYEGATGSWQLPAGPGLPENTGWLFVYEINTGGVRPKSEMLPIFVTDDGTLDRDIGNALIERAVSLKRFRHDSAIAVDEVSVRTIDHAFEVAEKYLENLTAEQQATVIQEAGKRIKQERKRLEAWFDHREQSATDKVNHTREILNRLQKSTEAKERKIIPVWVANYKNARKLQVKVAKDRIARIADLEQHRRPVVDHQLVAAARIDIRSPATAQDVGEG